MVNNNQMYYNSKVKLLNDKEVKRRNCLDFQKNKKIIHSTF